MSINKVLKETAKAVTGIKHYGNGLKYNSNLLDQSGEAVDSEAHYPLLWVYNIEAEKGKGGYILPLNATYTVQLFIVDQVEMSGDTESLTASQEVTELLCDKFIVALSRHPSMTEKMGAFKMFNVPPSLLDDNVTGWYMQFTIGIKQIDPSCLTPVEE